MVPHCGQINTIQHSILQHFSIVFSYFHSDSSTDSSTLQWAVPSQPGRWDQFLLILFCCWYNRENTSRRQCNHAERNCLQLCTRSLRAFSRYKPVRYRVTDSRVLSGTCIYYISCTIPVSKALSRFFRM